MSKNKNNGLSDRLFDFFCSVRLSIFVLVALAITSIFGTVLQQGDDYAVYVQSYGESMAKVIDLLSLDDMYHSWWFTLLLALLLVNITFCSIKRMPGAIRQMRDREPRLTHNNAALHEKVEKTLSGQGAEEVAERVSTLLAKKLGKVERAEEEGSIFLMASRGGWARMGVYVTHFSLFLFAFGAIVGLQFGFKGFVGIVEGNTVSQFDARDEATPKMDFGFEVRCDSFELELYPDGRPKDYRSTLTVIENGKELYSKRIEVNDPLIHNGIYLYQSSYGQVGVESTVVTVADAGGQIVASQQPLVPQQMLKLPDGSELIIRDIWRDRQNRTPPAVVMALVRDGRIVGNGRVHEPNPRFTWWPVGPYRIRLDDVDWLEYTGLQVAKDPGVPIVWAGCILMTLGLMVSFFFSHRRVWAKITEEKGDVHLLLAGNASRNRIAFERWFEELSEEADAAFEK